MRICINVWVIILEANDLLRLNVPVNNFSVMSGRSHRFLGITSTIRGVNLAQGHNTAEVGIEPQPLALESEALPLGHRAPLQVMRTCINAWMSSYFGKIPQMTPELSALERLKNL